MVPAKLEELQQLYKASELRTIDLQKYNGPLFDVIFEMMTTDSFIAGIASKILDNDLVEIAEREVVKSPVFIDGRWWQCDDGQLFDLQKHTEVRQVAMNIERLRAKCNEVLVLKNGNMLNELSE